MKEQRHLSVLLRLGKKIGQTRKDQGLSQNELAKKANIHRVRLSEIENGSPTSIVTLVDILVALNKMDLLRALLEPKPTQYDTVFSEVSSKVFETVEELKGNRLDKRSDIMLPNKLVEKYGK